MEMPSQGYGEDVTEPFCGHRRAYVFKDLQEEPVIR
jgi:hypothetical protein